jgi:hypothetical protein
MEKYFPYYLLVIKHGNWTSPIDGGFSQLETSAYRWFSHEKILTYDFSPVKPITSPIFIGNPHQITILHPIFIGITEQQGLVAVSTCAWIGTPQLPVCICGGLENNIHKICIYNIIILQYVTWNAWYVTYNMWSYNSSLFLRRWSGVCRVSPMSGQNNVVMWLVFGLNFCTFPKDMLSINVSTYAHHINRSHSKSAAVCAIDQTTLFESKHQPPSTIISRHQTSSTIISHH